MMMSVSLKQHRINKDDAMIDDGFVARDFCINYLHTTQQNIMTFELKLTSLKKYIYIINI